MMVIKSRQNPLIRSVRALRQNKVRRVKKKFLVEGVRLLEEAVSSGCTIDTVLCCTDILTDSLSKKLLQKLDCQGVSVVATTPDVLASVAETKSPPGLIAVVCFPSLPAIDPIIENSDLIVLGDKIQDPGNAGTIIRTSEAARVGGVFFTPGSVYPYSDKVIRASMGSLFRLPVAILPDNGRKLYEYCLKRGWQSIFTVPEGGIPWWQVDFTQPTLVVLGNEGAGISPEMQAATKGLKVSIPLAPPVESLNVAIASAVILFEAVRQRSISH